MSQDRECDYCERSHREDEPHECEVVDLKRVIDALRLENEERKHNAYERSEYR